MLCLLGLAGPVMACSPLPPVIVKLPAGLDGRLPVMPPLPDPNYPYIPPATSGMCGTPARFGYNANVPALSNQEVSDRLGSPVTPLAPGWLASQIYNAGDQASFNAKNYSAKWWTQGQQPDTPNGAWDLSIDPLALPNWDATRAYNAGEQVIYAGKLYRAKWWTQNEQPGSNEWGAWALQGDAPATSVDVSKLPGDFTVSAVKTDGQLFVRYTAYGQTSVGYTQMNNCQIEVHPPMPDPTLADSWEIHVDGVKVFSSPLGAPYSSAIPPAPPALRNPDGSCVSGIHGLPGATVNLTSTASTTVPLGTSRFVSVWSCKGTQCRPSKLFDHSLTGQPTTTPPLYVAP
jgi:chitodextrinase